MSDADKIAELQADYIAMSDLRQRWAEKAIRMADTLRAIRDTTKEDKTKKLAHQAVEAILDD